MMPVIWRSEGHELYFGNGRHGQISTSSFASLLAMEHNDDVERATAPLHAELAELKRCEAVPRCHEILTAYGISKTCEGGGYLSLEERIDRLAAQRDDARIKVEQLQKQAATWVENLRAEINRITAAAKDGSGTV